MRTSDIILGSDPEIFVEHKDGTLFPAFGYLPSKYEPLKTEEDQSYYWDGFQAEFNIVPSDDVKECLRSIRCGLEAVLSAAKKHDPDARLSTKTVFPTPLEMLRTLPPEFVEFGCMPSFNIYGIEGVHLDGVNCPHRFAGGHIHFGISHLERAMNGIPDIVRALDAILGVACVSLFENFDDPIRRKHYGLAGEHRLPPHGLEYRALSDAWLFNPKLANMMLDFARKIVVYALSGKNEWQADTGEVVECILRSDVNMARKILERNAQCLPKIGYKSTIDLMQPVEKSVEMSDISANWNL